MGGPFLKQVHLQSLVYMVPTENELANEIQGYIWVRKEGYKWREAWLKTVRYIWIQQRFLKWFALRFPLVFTNRFISQMEERKEQGDDLPRGRDRGRDKRPKGLGQSRRRKVGRGRRKTVAEEERDRGKKKKKINALNIYRNNRIRNKPMTPTIAQGYCVQGASSILHSCSQ